MRQKVVNCHCKDIQTLLSDNVVHVVHVAYVAHVVSLIVYLPHHLLSFRVLHGFSYIISGLTCEVIFSFTHFRPLKA